MIEQFFNSMMQEIRAQGHNLPDDLAKAIFMGGVNAVCHAIDNGAPEAVQYEIDAMNDTLVLAVMPAAGSA